MNVDVVHGDCLAVLPTLGDGAVDCIVTDPPYGIHDSSLQTADSKRTGVRRGKRTAPINDWHPPSDWDHEIDPEWCRQCCRVAPLVAWFGHWRKRELVAAAMPHPLRAEIVWAKDCHVSPPCPLAMRDERIWLFSAREIKGRRFETSVWDEPILPTWAHKHHKNEKPLGLMRRLIEFLTSPGALVVDPFAGSGTTAVACLKSGRRCLAIESDERYIEVIHRRLKGAETPLFQGLSVD
jgi:DNA modification methylase